MLCEFSRRSFLKGSAAAAAALACPLCPADAAPSPSENGLFSPVTPLRPTQYGPVRGRAREGGTLCWYGIPYGAAPTGEDRWTSPREPARWRTVRDCTAPAPAAYQYTSFPLGTEDCLTLDIYSVPEAKKRPVLVYLHGSAFSGSPQELPGSALVRDTGCVFVALSYRLGLFGWNCLPALTTGSDAAGNFALLDILRALDWVKENIHHFGGDGASITLCGFSDGGRMAAALAASPLSRGRFQRAAALSGGWSLADPDASARQLAERFAPLAVEDGLFADPASAAGWLLTPGADVREWLCGLDPARIAAIFREEGVIPVAQLAAFKDPISSRTDRSMAIHYGDGLWLDAQKDGNAWLNPYSAAAVEYVGDLVAEVQGMGFEQVVLTNVQFPKLSRKQDYGETSGVSRADQLKADIAALQSRFAGSMTLWFSYTLDQCNTNSVSLDVPAVTLGMDNLLVTADKAVDADSRTALEQSAAGQGVQHLVLHSADIFQ